MAKNVDMEEKNSLPSWPGSLQLFQQVWEQGMDGTLLSQTQLFDVPPRIIAHLANF